MWEKERETEKGCIQLEESSDKSSNPKLPTKCRGLKKALCNAQTCEWVKGKGCTDTHSNQGVPSHS